MGMTNEEREKEIRKQPIPTKEECLAFYKELVKLADVRFVPYYNMAIKALEQQPCEDCISREQTLKAFAEKCGGECACCGYNGSGYDNAENCKLIKSMPSVTPSRPRGKWIVEREEITTEDCFISYPHTKCSLCKVEVRFATNFCPCCGADMRKSEDKE